MLNTAIVGAGPYGLSIAAHFRRRGIPFRIFGRPMDSWLAHMPKGMMLKSDGFASNIYDPESAFTLRQFCAERGIEYADAGTPVRLETFATYGLAFRDRMVPELEDKLVVSVDRLPDGFRLQLEDGETVQARTVVLAVGITHFEYVPENLAHLPPEFLSHSAHHHEVEPFRGRSVVVIGGGASALDLAGLLHEAGAKRAARQPQDGIEVSQPADGQATLSLAANQASAIGPRSGFAVAFLCRCPSSVSLLARASSSGGCPKKPRSLWRMVHPGQSDR